MPNWAQITDEREDPTMPIFGVWGITTLKESVIISIYANLKMLMHQSFVTTAPLPPPPPPHPTGKMRGQLFIHNSPAKSPVLRGPAESHSPALHKSKFHGVYLRNITSPALTRYCGGTQKVIAPHINPAIPRPSP